ncbi:MAG: hypothetical protein ICV83_00190 [Cytophagales bacterium]|nr:hypothetical protein [Cytophagales bacterium]
MNKLLFAAAALLLAGSPAWAQGDLEAETMTLTEVKKGEEPQAVLDAVKQDFPGATVGNIAILPHLLYGEEWDVTTDDDDDDEAGAPDYYQVSASGKNTRFTAVYDKTGKLLRSRETLKDAALPDAVTATLTKRYAGWKVDGDREKIKDAKGVTVSYKVLLQKGKEKRRVAFDPGGKIIKEKKLV